MRLCQDLLSVVALHGFQPQLQPSKPAVLIINSLSGFVYNRERMALHSVVPLAEFLNAVVVRIAALPADQLPCPLQLTRHTHNVAL